MIYILITNFRGIDNVLIQYKQIESQAFFKPKGLEFKT